MVAELVPEMEVFLSEISKQSWHGRYEYDSSEDSILVGTKNETYPIYQVFRRSAYKEPRQLCSIHNIMENKSYGNMTVEESVAKLYELLISSERANFKENDSQN